MYAFLEVLRRLFLERGAKSKDLIFVTGPFGYTGAGLSILLTQKERKERVCKKSYQVSTKTKTKTLFWSKEQEIFFIINGL